MRCMADAVAIAAVVATAGVALFGNLTQVVMARGAREHEREMARDQRAADDRREAQGFRTDLAKWCIDIRRALDKPGEDLYLLRIGRRKNLDSMALVQGSETLRAALKDLDLEMASSWPTISPLMWSLESVVALKESELDAQNFDAASDARQRELGITSEINRASRMVRERLDDVQAILSE